MVIVAGHLIVRRGERDGYLAGCVPVVDQARSTPGCLDFTISADLVDAARINIFERWDSRDAVAAFRGSGPSDDQADLIVSASVSEYDVSGERRLTESASNVGGAPNHQFANLPPPISNSVLHFVDRGAEENSPPRRTVHDGRRQP